MNRRVAQSIDKGKVNSAKLCVKLCETLRDILFVKHKFYERSELKLIVEPAGLQAGNPAEGGGYNTPMLCGGIWVQGTDKSSVFDLPWGSYP